MILNVLGLDSGPQSLTLKDWYKGDQYQVEAVLLPNGEEIDIDNIQFVLFGTEAPDHLMGTEASEVIKGFAGDDMMMAEGGNDTLIGGLGNDYLVGGAGDDTYVWGLGDGNDQIDDFDMQEMMTGIKGYDVVEFGEGIQVSDISWSRSPFGLSATVNQVDGTEQTLTINGWYYGEVHQPEEIRLTNGEVLDISHVLSLPLQGTEYMDHLMGAESDEEIRGMGGNDWIFGFGGNDSLYGGADNDHINGFDGNDLLSGGTGDDHIEGGMGDDVLIVGEAGSDSLYGGMGQDLYLWVDGQSGDPDSIYDFNINEDQIDLRNLLDIEGNSLDFNDLMMWQQGSDTIVQANDQSLVLKGVSQYQLSAELFVELGEEAKNQLVYNYDSHAVL